MREKVFKMQQIKKENEFSRNPCPDTCGFRNVIFQGVHTETEFCEWLFTDAHKDVTVMAHNAKGFDSHFLLHFLLKLRYPCSDHTQNYIEWW